MGDRSDVDGWDPHPVFLDITKLEMYNMRDFFGCYNPHPVFLESRNVDAATLLLKGLRSRIAVGWVGTPTRFLEITEFEMYTMRHPYGWYSPHPVF